MIDVCAICHRKSFGCLIAKTKNPAKYPLKIELINDIGRLGSHYSYQDLIIICIDCRPGFEKKLKEFFKSINLEPHYNEYEQKYILNKERYDAD